MKNNKIMEIQKKSTNQPARRSATITQNIDIFKQQSDLNKKKAPTNYEKMMNSTAYKITQFIVVLWAMLQQSIRYIGSDKNQDLYFDVINILALLFSILDILFEIKLSQNYLKSVNFIIDFFVLSTLVLELQIVKNDIISNENSIYHDSDQVDGNNFQSSQYNNYIFYQEILSYVDIIKLIRILKLFENSELKYSFQNDLSILQQKMEAAVFNFFFKQNESGQNKFQISKQLTNVITQKCIIISLLLVIINNIFEQRIFQIYFPQYQYDFNLLMLVIQNENQQQATLFYQNFLDDFSQQTPILYASFQKYNFVYNELPDYADKLRISEYIKIIFNQDGYKNLMVIDARQIRYYQSILTIFYLIFLILVFYAVEIFLIRSLNNNIIIPLEQILNKTNQIAQDPIKAKFVEVNKNVVIKQKEMIQIENTIIKIGTLLALGFGEAGGLVIARNFQGQGDQKSSGRNKVAIFGFCDIRNFTDATEVLQTEVMQFVNTIAEIVHSEADLYLGAANKNIGDAFLIVWRAPSYLVQYKDTQLVLKKNQESSKLCDFALYSIIKIIIRLNTEPKILAYRQNKRLNQRMPNYKIKLGFGLHQGWAIEGAIGSRFKIDASYLSPNVNIAGALEAATKSYGATLLLSKDVYDYLSLPMQKICRQVDNVFLNGEEKGIYSVDLKIEKLENKIKYRNYSISLEDKQNKQNMKKKQIKDKFLNSNFDIQSFLDKKTIKLVLPDQKDPFFELFKNGMMYFIQGKWKDANDSFSEAKKLIPDDVPTKNLLEFINSQQLTPPLDWKGYRNFE